MTLMLQIPYPTVRIYGICLLWQRSSSRLCHYFFVYNEWLNTGINFFFIAFNVPCHENDTAKPEMTSKFNYLDYSWQCFVKMTVFPTFSRKPLVGRTQWRN